MSESTSQPVLTVAAHSTASEAAAPSETLRLGADRKRAVHVVKPERPGLIHAWSDAWAHRQYFLYLGSTFLRKRYARTWLGSLWLPLRPSMNLGAKILVFGGLIGVSAGRVPYPLYFIIATAIWQLFSECFLWSIRSIELNRKVAREIYVPRLVYVSSAIVPSGVDFLIYAGFAVIALIYYYVRSGIFYLTLGYSTLLVPLGLVLAALLGVGAGLLAAGLGARARDMRFLAQFSMGFVYFLTPVIYPLSQVPDKWRPVAELNPVTGAMELVKRGFFVSESFSINAVWVTLGVVLVIWVPGLWFVRRRELAFVTGSAPEGA